MFEDHDQPRRLEERFFRELLLALSMGIVALLQVSLLPAPVGFPPALLLVVVVCRVLVGWRLPRPDLALSGAVRWAFYGGLALDIFATTPLGLHALALTLATTVIAALTRRLQVEGPMLVLAAMLLAALVYELVLAGVGNSDVLLADWQAYLIVVMLPSLLMALVLALPTFMIMRWVSRRQ